MILRVLAQETEKKKKGFLSLAGTIGRRADSTSLAGHVKTMGAEPEDNLETSA